MQPAHYLSIPGIADLIRQLAGRFPDTRQAVEPGIVCQGGALSLPWLLAAYSRGIFPWFNEGDPILWWSPDPRCVILPEDYHCPKRSLRAIRRANFTITCDRAFALVIQACSMRKHTWLTAAMKQAVFSLHQTGFAHSVEAWQDGHLAGGLYGLSLGRAFFGESMFHTVSEASRACLRALVDLMRLRGMTLLDCQQETAHIMAQGAHLLAREDFEARLTDALAARADSADALTREYTEDWASHCALWPFLPWRSSYVFEEGCWHETDAGSPV